MKTAKPSTRELPSLEAGAFPANQIRAIRYTKNISLSALAKACRVDVAALSRIERQHAVLTPLKRERIAAALGVAPETL